MKQATLSQASKILSVFEDMPSDQVQVILESGFLADLCDANIATINRDEFRRVCSLEPPLPRFTLTINYSLPLAEAIAKGKYDWFNNDITADHFPDVGADTAELETQLVHFDRTMESDDVLKELDQSGLRPGTLRELLAFGEQHPDTQRQFAIIALGSVWRDRGDYRRVPVLWGSADERGLSLYWYDGRWVGDYRFLAFRK